MTARVRVSRFGPRTVIAGIDLELRAGQFVALLGRSGTGKSTLSAALAGLGSDAPRATSNVPATRSVVFQDPVVLSVGRVIDNVVLGQPGPDVVRRGADRVAPRSKPGRPTSTTGPRPFRGGEAQRVAARPRARATTRLLLLDEPFGALDVLTRIRMHALVGPALRPPPPGRLLVTHDVDEALLGRPHRDPDRRSHVARRDRGAAQPTPAEPTPSSVRSAGACCTSSAWTRRRRAVTRPRPPPVPSRRSPIADSYQ